MQDIDDIMRSLEDKTPPQIDVPEEPKKVLRLARSIKDPGETIAKLVNNRWYVGAGANLLELADDLTTFPDIQAVGVVDEDDKVLGVIVRRDLFNLLGRPFGRDVMRRELASRVAQSTQSFYHDTNIFSVSESLSKVDHSGEVQFFPLKTGTGEFVGTFSSQDLLIYLSRITQNDIALARSIQSRIVKEFSYHEDEHLEFAGSSTMAKGVGGDFYAEALIQENRWMHCLCDVSGKGMAASLVTTALWGSLRTFDYRRGIGSLIKTLNQVFISTFELEKYVTGIFADINAATGTLLLADMGHGFSFLLRNKQLLKMKAGASNMPIGVVHDLRPEISRYQLEPGDLLLFVTDGIIEQTNEIGEEFGLGRIKQFLMESTSKSLKTQRIELMERFHSFRKQTPLHDDVTFLMIRYKG